MSCEDLLMTPFIKTITLNNFICVGEITTLLKAIISEPDIPSDPAAEDQKQKAPFSPTNVPAGGNKTS